jgi:Cu-Zn family superoxide dismutase
MKRTILVATLLVLSLGVVVAAGKKGLTAKADLWSAQGDQMGTAQFKEVKGGVEIMLRVANLSPGEHAFHIHAVGKCDSPDFKTAGGHFNPEGKKHGLSNPEGPHAGDMPNITVNAKGKANVKIVNSRVTLGDGPNSLFHEGGTALIIHEKADDGVTDPAGNAGNRIACGVIEKTP